MSVLRTQLSALVRRPSRILLTGLALIVAAFVVFGMVLAQQSTERTLTATFSGTPEAADLVVGDQGDPVTKDAADKIRAIPGVAAVAGRTVVFCPLAKQSYQDWLVVRSDPGAGPLSTVRLLRGGYPDAGGQIAVTQRLLDRNRLNVGSTITVELDRPAGVDATASTAPTARARPGASIRPVAQPVTLTITGVVEGTENGAHDVYTTEAVALSLTDPTAGVDQIDVRLEPGASADAVRTAITGAVRDVDGKVPEIRTGAQVRDDEMRERVGGSTALFAIISMFVAIAVAAAVLVATSTFRIVFAQRLRQFALLRAVGAGRARLTWALLVEGLLTGVVAGGTGVLGAALCGQVVPAVLRAFGRDVVAPGLPPASAVAVVVGTAVIAVIAVCSPALSASRVSPLEALRTSSTTSGQRGIGVLRAVVGGLLTVAAVLIAGLVLANLPASSPLGMLLALVLSGTLAYFALVALGPVLLRPVLAVVGWPLRGLGPVGRLAAGGVGAASRRAAAVSVVVALGVTLMAGVLIGGASLRQELERELAGMAPADFQLASVAEGDAGLPAEAVQRARQRPELRNVVPYRSTVVSVDDMSDGSTAVDVALRDLSTWPRFGATSGSLDRFRPGTVVLGRFFTEGGTAQIDSMITVRKGDRSVELRVVAIMPTVPLDGGLLIAPEDLDRLGVSPAPSGLFADASAAGEQGRTAAYGALRQAGGGTTAGNTAGAVVNSYADTRDEIYDQVDLLMGVAVGLISLTVLVAVVGVGATTALSVVERVREAGMLRAIGMSRAGLRTMLTMESGLYGVIGAVLGLALALPYAWLCLATLSTDYPVVFPAGQLAGVMVALALFTALAGVVPAGRAARVAPVAALGADE